MNPAFFVMAAVLFAQRAAYEWPGQTESRLEFQFCSEAFLQSVIGLCVLYNLFNWLPEIRPWSIFLTAVLSFAIAGLRKKAGLFFIFPLLSSFPLVAFYPALRLGPALIAAGEFWCGAWILGSLWSSLREKIKFVPVSEPVREASSLITAALLLQSLALLSAKAGLFIQPFEWDASLRSFLIETV